MKKRILSLILAMLLSVTVFSVSAAAADDTAFYTRDVTSHDMSDYISVEIEGTKCTLGILTQEDDFRFAFISADGERGETETEFEVTPNKYSECSVSLSGLAGNETEITLFKGPERYGNFMGVFWGGRVMLRKYNNVWAISVPMCILNGNLSLYYGSYDLTKYTPDDVSEDIREMSDSICDGLDTDYEKARAIHDWVSKNIYYDFDCLSRINSNEWVDCRADAVLETRRSVCEGYANIFKALCDAQEIPCIKIAGDSGGGEVAEWRKATQEKPTERHAWNEVYAGGRWIIVDSTWDSGNEYRNGEYAVRRNSNSLYFDCDIVHFSANHRIMSTPKAPKLLSDISAAGYLDSYGFLNYGSAGTPAFGGNSGVCGRYNAVSCIVNDKAYGCEGDYITLLENGTGMVAFASRSVDFKWTLSGNMLTFVDSEQKVFTGTLIDGVVSGNYAGINYVFEPEEQKAERIPGDINGDGLVDMLDPLLLLKFVCKESVEAIEESLDVSGDGKIDMLDPLLLLKFVCKEPVTIY